MEDKLTKQDCLELLRHKYGQLAGQRYPQRSDFSEREVVAIKAHLGPWPRALEAAGIKPARDDSHAEKARQKRIQAKRARTAAKIARQADPNQITNQKENAQ